jgi:hypothetical protein
MSDLAFVSIVVLFFLLTWGFVRLAEKV